MSKLKWFPRTAWVIGASSGVGRKLVEALSKNGVDLVISARKERDLHVLASDCSVRYGNRVNVLPLDLSKDFDADELVKGVYNFLPMPLESVFLVAGANSLDDDGPPPTLTLDLLARVNFLAPSKIMSALLRSSSRPNLKRIVVFSTISTQAPRQKNAAYAAAKAALETFSQSMRHFLVNSETIIQVYRLGYIDTKLAFGQKLLFPVVSPERVAQKVLSGINRDFGLKYFPCFWSFVVFVIASLPWAIFKRLKF